MPILGWIQSVAATVMQALQQGNPLVFVVLFGISTLVEISIPVPSIQDAVLLFLGYDPTGRLLALVPLVMLTLMAGRVFGGSLVYWLARSQGPRFDRLIARRFPRVQRLASGFNARIGKRTPVAVALARLTPGLLVPTTLAAGTFRVSYPYFCIGVVVSSIVPDLAEVGSGLAARSGLKLAGMRPGPDFFILPLAVMMITIWLSSWLWTRRSARRKEQEANGREQPA